MNWKLKAAAFRLFDRMPFGGRAYFLTQRHITRSLPRRLYPCEPKAAQALRHLDAYRRHGIDLPHARYLEFGAGWDLYNNLVLYCHGVDQQRVLDLHRHARPDLINHVIAYLRQHPPAGAVRLPERLLSGEPGTQLRAWYGIDYRAPADAAATGLPAGSIDLISTTSTLEHIPPPAIGRILRECRRLCHAGSLMSMIIDYSDHYAHSDGSIGVYNFLRFGDAEWARYNSATHFQNRLRDAEYRTLFQDAGFAILEHETSQPADAAAALSRVPLSPRFASFPVEQLTPTLGRFLLRPEP